MLQTTSKFKYVVLGVLPFVIVGGCTPLPPGSQATGATGVSKTGGVCGTLRTELRTHERRGVPYRAEAMRTGSSKFSQKQRDEIARYEQVLGDYLSQNCHAKTQ